MGEAKPSRGTAFSAETLSMSAIARVAVVSNLPQLDKLFDYQIPDELLSKAKIGSRVLVPFGKGTKIYEGFIFDIEETTSFQGKLAEVSEVIGDNPSLDKELIELVQELALRSAASLGEMLKLAVPSHMARSFKSHSFQVTEVDLPGVSCAIDTSYVESLTARDSRHAIVVRPASLQIQRIGESFSSPHWVALMCLISSINLQGGKSTILAVPDYRDQQVLLDALKFCGLGDFVANYSQEQVKSKIYEGYLRALDPAPRVIVGSRSVMLAPAHNLGTIAVFDDGDASFTDQAAPYLNARDSALVRQSIQKNSLVFLSHARSTDIQRLVETSYILESTLAFPKPKISISEPGFRVDSHALTAIKHGLDSGSVLVQVASKGESTALFCTSCDQKLSCPTCSGPVWVDGRGSSKCRWCNALVSSSQCSCGSTGFSKGRAGSSRTAAELGKSFPGSKVVESTGENRILSVKPGKNLVVATAGAEPFVEGGYNAVIILDAQATMSRQYLRASEEAVRIWANAISKLAIDGEGVLVGVSGALAQKFCLWQHIEIASDELSSRRELALPPALRLGSASGSQAILADLATSLVSFGKVKVLGPAPHSLFGESSEWRLIFKYNYSDTVEVAKFLRGEAIRLSRGKSVVAASGRSMRAVKIRMSDGDVV
jgi:primosomal protein N' (replication factor Y)